MVAELDQGALGRGAGEGAGPRGGSLAIDIPLPTPPPTDVPLPTLEVGSRPQRPAIDEVVQVEGVPGEVEVRLSASYSMKS